MEEEGERLEGKAFGGQGQKKSWVEEGRGEKKLEL